MNTLLIRNSLIGSILTICTCAHAEVFKWVDQNGATHYGDTPGQARAQTIAIEQQQIRPDEADDLARRRQRIRAWVDARHAEREQKKSEMAEQHKQLALREAHCRELESNLRDRELGGIVWYRLGEDGARHYMSDQEIVQETNELREALATSCR